MNEIEPVHFYNNLKAWRIRNGYTTPEWEAYAKVVTLQDFIINVVLLYIGMRLAYLLGRGAI